MNKDFESMISDYIDKELSVEDIKIFENHMLENSSFAKKVNNISNMVSSMNETPKIETSINFLNKLDSKINKKSILNFWFSPVFRTRISYTFLALVILFLVSYEDKTEQDIIAFDENKSNSLNTIESDTLKNDSFIIKQVVGKKKNN